MNALEWLVQRFYNKPTEPVSPVLEPKVEPGQEYSLNSDDPFESKYGRVTVLEVKNGWLRYKIGEGVIFNDERKPIKEFLRIYRLCKP